MDLQSRPVITSFEAFESQTLNKVVDPAEHEDAEDHTQRTDEMSDESKDDEFKGECWDPVEDEDEKETTSNDTASTSIVEESTVIVSSSSSSIVTPILKRCDSEPMHLKSSRRSWKCLPPPNMDHLLARAQSERVGKVESTSSRRSTKGRGGSVKFDKIHMRSYQQTLGDNPSVSYGPPIQLDWEYEEHESIQLDEYEDNRPKRRNLRQMILSYYQRKNVLTWQYGYSEDVLKKAKKDAERVKMKRSMTKALLPTMIVETALESAKRKATRLISGGKKSTGTGRSSTQAA